MRIGFKRSGLRCGAVWRQDAKTESFVPDEHTCDTNWLFEVAHFGPVEAAGVSMQDRLLGVMYSQDLWSVAFSPGVSHATESWNGVELVLDPDRLLSLSPASSASTILLSHRRPSGVSLLVPVVFPVGLESGVKGALASWEELRDWCCLEATRVGALHGDLSTLIPQPSSNASGWTCRIALKSASSS